MVSWTEEYLGTEKKSWKNEQKCIFNFYWKWKLGFEIRFDNENQKQKKKSKFYFILKRKLNVLFDPRIFKFRFKSKFHVKFNFKSNFKLRFKLKLKTSHETNRSPYLCNLGPGTLWKLRDKIPWISATLNCWLKVLLA